MLFSTFLFGGLALALPSVNIQRHAKRHDDVIAFGPNGRVEVFQRDYYDELTKNLTRGPPAFAYPELTHGANGFKKHDNNQTVKPTATSTTSTLTADAELEKRGCKSHMMIDNHVTSFIGWDVAMSRVIHAAAAQSTVILTSGFQIGNSIGVSEAAAFDFVPDFFTSTTTVSYEHSWVTTDSFMYSFPVPVGNYGIVVSNPHTTRNYGEVYQGCIGAMELISTYQADSFEDHTYEGISWVEGSITACTSTTYPIPMCIGSGFLE